MKNSTTQANVRSGPKCSSGSLGHTGSMILTLPISFDPTAASADTGINLPADALVFGFLHDGGATGGISPTFDIGISGISDYFSDEVAADAAGFAAANSTGAMVATTEPTSIYAGVGDSAATGGTITGLLVYVMVDSEAGLNE